MEVGESPTVSRYKVKAILDHCAFLLEQQQRCLSWDVIAREWFVYAGRITRLVENVQKRDPNMSISNGLNEDEEIDSVSRLRQSLESSDVLREVASVTDGTNMNSLSIDEVRHQMSSIAPPVFSHSTPNAAINSEEINLEYSSFGERSSNIQPKLPTQDQVTNNELLDSAVYQDMKSHLSVKEQMLVKPSTSSESVLEEPNALDEGVFIPMFGKANTKKKRSLNNDEVLYLSEWTLILQKQNNLANLAICGNIVNSRGKVLEKNITTKPVISVSKSVVSTKEKSYILLGSSTLEGIPKDIVKKFMRNKQFPRFWMAMTKCWSNMNTSQTSDIVIEADSTVPVPRTKASRKRSINTSSPNGPAQCKKKLRKSDKAFVGKQPNNVVGGKQVASKKSAMKKKKIETKAPNENQNRADKECKKKFRKTDKAFVGKHDKASKSNKTFGGTQASKKSATKKKKIETKAPNENENPADKGRVLNPDQSDYWGMFEGLSILQGTRLKEEDINFTNFSRGISLSRLTNSPCCSRNVSNAAFESPKSSLLNSTSRMLCATSTPMVDITSAFF